MMDTRTGDTVARYVTNLRAALADLPPQDVDEIMEDVGLHVAEVADELRGAGDDDLAARLEARLGTPEQHAAELRAAAGYPPRATGDGAARPDLVVPRIALALLAIATVLPLFVPAADVEGIALAMVLAGGAALVSLLVATRGSGGLSGVAELPEVRRARDRLPGGVVREYALLLQPAWWVVRAGIAAVLVALLAQGRGAGLMTIALLTIPLALASVWVGRRSRADRRWLWAVLPLNTFAIAAALFVAESGYGPWHGYGFGGWSNGGQAQVIIENRPGGNIYPYDSNGKPLDGVYLYDEDGQPISGSAHRSECTPYGETPPPPANRYPLPVYEYVATLDGDRRCVERRAAPPSPDVDAPTGSVSPTPTGSAPPATTTAATTTAAPPATTAAAPTT